MPTNGTKDVKNDTLMISASAGTSCLTSPEAALSSQNGWNSCWYRAIKQPERKEGLERLELQNDDSMRHLHYGSPCAESTNIRLVDYYYIVFSFGINLRIFYGGRCLAVERELQLM